MKKVSRIGIALLLVLFSQLALQAQFRIPQQSSDGIQATDDQLQELKASGEIELSSDMNGKHMVHDPSMQAGLEKIAQRVLQYSPIEFSRTPVKILIINDINFGAEAYGDGTIVVDQNLVCTRSDQVVVYMIGHEISHIGRHDGVGWNIFINGLRKELAVFLVQNSDPELIKQKNAEMQERRQNFRFLQEVQAELWGVKLMVATGFRIPDGTELMKFYINDPVYPPKEQRVKMVLQEQSSFLKTCPLCAKTPTLNLSKLRSGCYLPRKL